MIIFMPSKYKAKPVDKLGSRQGTIGARINKALSSKWQTIEEIEKKVRGVSHKIILNRLHRGAYKGVLQYERIIRFRIK